MDIKLITPSGITSYLGALFGSHDFSGHDLLVRPSSLNSIPDDLVINACDCGPISKAMGFPVKCEKHVSTVIFCLLAGGSPSAVVRGVSLVVVFAVNLKSLAIAWVHVLYKIKDIVPAFADSYTATTVSIPSLVFGVGASGFHATPNLVERV